MRTCIDTYTNLDDRLFFAIPMTAGLLAGARTHKKESELRLAGQPSSEHSAVHTSKGVYGTWKSKSTKDKEGEREREGSRISN